MYNTMTVVNNTVLRDFPGGSMVETLPFNAGIPSMVGSQDPTWHKAKKA